MADDWRQPVSAEERRLLVERLSAPAGLCAGCEHLRVLASARSVFVRCGLADTDPRFPRYPALPVVACPGYLPYLSGWFSHRPPGNAGLSSGPVSPADPAATVAP